MSHNDPPSPVHASDEEYEKCRAKGEQLINATKASIEEAGKFFMPPVESAESKFTSTPALLHLNTWGYNLYDGLAVRDWWGDFKKEWGLTSALRANQLSDTVVSEGGKNVVHYVMHGDHEKKLEDKSKPWQDQEYTVDGLKYQCTGACCAFAMNTEEGVIMTINRKSPTHILEESNSTALPELRASSDIMYAVWKDKMEAHRVGDLNYFFCLNIINETTKKIVNRVVKGEDLPYYPGIVFLADEAEGQALLGTPNAIAIGYLLAQHKAAMGVRYVTAIHVFKCDADHEGPYMMFRIAKAGDNSQNRDEKG